MSEINIDPNIRMLSLVFTQENQYPFQNSFLFKSNLTDEIVRSTNVKKKLYILSLVHGNASKKIYKYTIFNFKCQFERKLNFFFNMFFNTLC